MVDRLAEGLSFEWRSEWHGEVHLLNLAESAVKRELGTRLVELAAAAKARRARIERRLLALAAPPHLAPVPPILDQVDQGLELALAQTRAGADRYAALAELSRRLSDAETAFACELNRTGAEESALLLDGLLALEVDRGVAMRAAADAAGPPAS